MSFKSSLIIFKILTITLLCNLSLFALAQTATITEIVLPPEIKTINSILSNNEEVVWLATGQGLYAYSEGSFIRYYDKSQPELYCINALASDKSGNKWFGTYNGVLVKFNQKEISKTIDIKSLCKSDNYLITSISINPDNKNGNVDVLLTTSGGEIFAYDTITGIVKNIESPSDATIYAIQYGYTPTIWLCTSDGFYTMNKNSKWKKKSDLYTAYGLFENEGKYWAIGRDEDKKAVLMLYYDEENIGKSNKYKWKNFDLQRLNNRSSRFFKLDFTSDEMVWIASENGLIRYNPHNANIREFTNDKKLRSSSIQHIAVQNDNLIWISTSGKHFFRVDLK